MGVAKNNSFVAAKDISFEMNSEVNKNYSAPELEHVELGQHVEMSHITLNRKKS